MNAGSSHQSRAADRWLLDLGVCLWIVAVVALTILHFDVEAVVSRNEAIARDLPSESRSLPAFESMPAFHSQLRLARSLPAVALLVVFVVSFAVRRFRSGVSVGAVAAGSGLFVALCTIMGLLWAMVLATTSA